MASESTTDQPLTCRTCGTELSDMRDDPNTGDGLEGATLLYWIACQRGVCPFCGQTEDCPHLVAFNRAGDFLYSSLDDWLPRYSEHGHYLEVLGIEEDWHLLDRLVDESPDPITAIEFHAEMHFNRYDYAPTGTVVHEALAARTRHEYAEALQQRIEERDGA